MKRLATLLVLLAFVGCIPVPPVPVERTPEMAAPLAVGALPAVEPFDVDDLAERYGDPDAVYLRYWSTDEHAFGEDRSDGWAYIQDRVAQYVILNPEAESVTTTSFRVVSGATLTGFVARVTGPDGRARQFTGADLVSEQDGLDMIYKLAFPDVERGSLVEAQYRTEHLWVEEDTPPLSEEYALQLASPVQSLRVRYVLPAAWGVQVKRIRQGVPPRHTSTVDTSTALRLIEFDRTDTPAAPDEPFSPYPREMGEYADLQITRIRDWVRYSPPDSWEDLGNRFSDHAFRRGRVFSTPVRSAANEALQARGGVMSDSVRLVQVVDWVQRQIEVVDIEETDLARMVRDRQGSPVTICGLTQAMLAEVGLESELILIRPKGSGYFDEGYVSARQFPIPAVSATVDGMDYVIFPYIEGLPVNYIPPPFQGSRALRIADGGFAGFIDLPTRDGDAYAVDESFDIRIGQDGIVQVEETKTLRGIAAYATRSAFIELDEEERAEVVRDLVTYTEGDIADLDYELVGLDDYGTPFEVRIRYSIDNAVTVTPEEILFQTGGLLSPASLGSFKVDTRDRQLPIRLYYDEITNKSIRIRYPSVWALSTALDDVDTSSRFGTVTGRYTVTPGEVVAQQSVRLVESEAPPSEYSELLRLTGTQSELYIPALVFEVVR